MNAIIPRGQFNNSVCLERLVDGIVDGEISHGHQPLARVGAKIVPRASFTIKQADRVSDACTHLVTIDYRPGVGGTSRIVLSDGRTLEIKGLPRRDDERRPRYLEFECVETG